MALLLDTHIFLFVTRLVRIDVPSRMMQAIIVEPDVFVSVVSFWEMAIKCRAGKLSLPTPLARIPELAASHKIMTIDMNAQDSVAEVAPMPPTRDPFDRMLLTQSALRHWRLVTLDRALIDHPLAWSPN